MSLPFFRRITAKARIFHVHNLSPDLQTLHKQLIYRCGNLGMLELDIVVGSWAKQHIPSLNYEECLKFNKEILQMETPVLTKYIIGELPLPEENAYLKKLKEFAFVQMKTN